MATMAVDRLALCTGLPIESICVQRAGICKYDFIKNVALKLTTNPSKIF